METPEIIGRGRRVGWLTLERPSIDGGGGGRRQYFLLNEISRQFEVHLLMPSGGAELRGNREFALPVWSKMASRITPSVPHLRNSHFGASARLYMRERKIETAIVAHLETCAALRQIMEDPEIATLLDVHNAYSRYYEARGKPRIARRWARLEADICSRADAIAALTREELPALDHGENLVLAPNGIHIDEWPTRTLPRLAERKGLAYFGSWTHEPNLLGLKWFIDNCWSAVLASDPTASLHLYGIGPRPRIQARNMEWRGYTHNLSEALTKHLGIIIPIVVGMGARVKFVEALASAVPVVSTSLGAEGYDVSTSLFLERNDSRGFTDACVAVLSDAAKYSEMGVRARHHAMSALSWRQSAEGLIDCLHGLTASP